SLHSRPRRLVHAARRGRGRRRRSQPSRLSSGRQRSLPTLRDPHVGDSKVALNAGGFSKGARFSIAVNVFAICGLGVAVAAVVLMLVGRLSYSVRLRADLTRAARFTLDPTASSTLRSL